MSMFRDISEQYEQKGYKGGWVCSNLRLDKSDPNGFQTALNIRRSIQENLDMDKMIQIFK